MADQEEKRAGGRDAAPRGSTRSTAGERKRAERKRQTRETLIEIANLMDATRGRTGSLGDDVDDLAGIIRRDADAMAETLANLAARAEPAAFVTDKVFGVGGPLSFFVSFGPFFRALVVRAREIRERQAAEQQETEQPPAPWEPQPAAE